MALRDKGNRVAYCVISRSCKAGIDHWQYATSTIISASAVIVGSQRETYRAGC